MPTGRRHLTRHEMQQPDEFVSWVSRASAWVEENTRKVVMGFSAAAGVALLGWGIYSFMSHRAAQAFGALGVVQKIARTPIGGEPGAGAGAFSSTEERASRILEEADRALRNYPSGEAASWVRYHRAAALLELKRNADAAEAIAPITASAGDSLLGDLSRLLAGRIEEGRGAYDRAAELYAAAAEKAGNRFPPEPALMDRARCLAAAGKRQEAIDAYQKLIDTYPDSPMSGRANQKLQDLKGGGAQG